MAKEKFVTKILINNGFSLEELKEMDQKQRNAIYSEGMKKYIKNFSHQPKEVVVHKATNPFALLEKPEEVYNLSIDFFRHLSVDDAVILFHKKFRSISIDKTQKIVKLLMCVFQESILGEIENKISALPESERRSIMDIYEYQKENITHLIAINERLGQEKFRQKFEEVLEIKMLVQKYKDGLKNEEDDDDE